MATELLERTAIPFFADRGLEFETLRDDVVRFSAIVPSVDVVQMFYIHDRGNGLLSINALRIVSFPEGQWNYAIEMCNKLNVHSHGTFYIDEGYLYHKMVVPTIENTGTREFEFAFVASTIELDSLYPAIMTVRWANATIEQALERREGGEPGTPIISDKQLRRLLGRDDSGQN